MVISFSLALVLYAISYTSAFSTSSSPKCSQDRRQVLSSLVSISGVLLPNIANAGLLDDYGTDPTQDKQPEKKKPELAKAKAKVESAVEPNLRSNYYYPTNKVRYLPRIKKCSDAIPGEYIDILSYCLLFCSTCTFGDYNMNMFCNILLISCVHNKHKLLTFCLYHTHIMCT